MKADTDNCEIYWQGGGGGLVQFLFPRERKKGGMRRAWSTMPINNSSKNEFLLERIFAQNENGRRSLMAPCYEKYKIITPKVKFFFSYKLNRDWGRFNRSLQWVPTSDCSVTPVITNFNSTEQQFDTLKFTVFFGTVIRWRHSALALVFFFESFLLFSEHFFGRPFVEHPFGNTLFWNIFCGTSFVEHLFSNIFCGTPFLELFWNTFCGKPFFEHLFWKTLFGTLFLANNWSN